MPLIYLILLCFASLSAEDDDLTSVAATEGAPSSLVQNTVCAITGGYVDSNLDLRIEAPEPFSIQRSYCNQRTAANLGTGFSLNHLDVYHTLWNL